MRYTITQAPVLTEHFYSRLVFSTPLRRSETPVPNTEGLLMIEAFRKPFALAVLKLMGPVRAFDPERCSLCLLIFLDKIGSVIYICKLKTIFRRRSKQRQILW